MFGKEYRERTGKEHEFNETGGKTSWQGGGGGGGGGVFFFFFFRGTPK